MKQHVIFLIYIPVQSLTILSPRPNATLIPPIVQTNGRLPLHSAHHAMITFHRESTVTRPLIPLAGGTSCRSLPASKPYHRDTHTSPTVRGSWVSPRLSTPLCIKEKKRKKKERKKGKEREREPSITNDYYYDRETTFHIRTASWCEITMPYCS